MSSENTNSGGISFLGLLAIVFITLKLTDVIDWSWWYVTMPLWGGLAIVAVLLCVYLFILVLELIYNFCTGQ